MCNEYFNLCDDMTVDQRTDFFLDRLWSLYNRHFPKKTKTVSRKKYLKPWIDTNIRRMAGRL